MRWRARQNGAWSSRRTVAFAAPYAINTYKHIHPSVPAPPKPGQPVFHDGERAHKSESHQVVKIISPLPHPSVRACRTLFPSPRALFLSRRSSWVSKNA